MLVSRESARKTEGLVILVYFQMLKKSIFLSLKHLNAENEIKISKWKKINCEKGAMF